MPEAQGGVRHARLLSATDIPICGIIGNQKKGDTKVPFPEGSLAQFS